MRSAGLLGEVIDIAGKGDGCQYILNLFAQDTDEILVYQLDEIEPVWHGRSEWDMPISWPSWTR